jgi:hypothetical protein
MNEEDALIHRSLQAALVNRAPIQVEIDSRTWFVLQVLSDFIIVTVGLHGRGSTPVTVLKRRYECPERLSVWLPAMMKDGTLIAVRRLPRIGNNQVESLGLDGFDSARELLS